MAYSGDFTVSVLSQSDNLLFYKPETFAFSKKNLRESYKIRVRPNVESLNIEWKVAKCETKYAI